MAADSSVSCQCYMIVYRFAWFFYSSRNLSWAFRNRFLNQCSVLLNMVTMKKFCHSESRWLNSSGPNICIEEMAANFSVLCQCYQFLCSNRTSGIGEESLMGVWYIILNQYSVILSMLVMVFFCDMRGAVIELVRPTLYFTDMAANCRCRTLILNRHSEDQVCMAGIVGNATEDEEPLMGISKRMINISQSKPGA